MPLARVDKAEGEVNLHAPRKPRYDARCSVWQDRVCDLDGHERRCRQRQFQFPTEQDTRRDSIAARYLRQAGSRPRRLLDDPAFIRLAKRPPVARAGRRHDRVWEVVSHI
jgi:hypothetical protein